MSSASARHEPAPERRCDVIMKGGITSGIVYPLAAIELAKRFRFINIGGTSAGAVAAAAVAAAERGRLDRRGQAFVAVEGLPEWLGTRPGAAESNLFRLFQPTAATQPLFAILVAAVSHPKQTAAFELALAAARSFRRWAAAGALAGMILFVALFWAIAPDAVVWESLVLLLMLVLAAAFAVLGAIVAVGFGLFRRAPTALRDNLFGICAGSYVEAEPSPRADGWVPQTSGKPLTPWLADLIDQAAGHAPNEPLTFADLWGSDPYNKDLDLRMITSCLTLRRPYLLPFEPSEHLQFKPSEFVQLFPRRIVDAIAPPGWEDDEDRPVTLPVGGDLPVVVAARMSLSFPLLLSAVPLYRPNPADETKPLRLWFSDGGISSNFPMQLFDSPLPRWPTFGINLEPADGASELVWMPSTNTDSEPDQERKIADVAGLAKAIGDVMQNWHDNATAAMPGYRDRIVAIRLEAGEGGMNLNMPDELITALSNRGQFAGYMLAERFTTAWDAPQAPQLSWDNHRWVRYRNLLATLEELLVKLLKGWGDEADLARLFPSYHPSTPVSGERSYRTLMEDPRRQPTPTGLDADQALVAIKETRRLVNLAKNWILRRGDDYPEIRSPSLQLNAPEPGPELRAVPRI